MAQPGLILDDRYRLDDRIAAGGMGEVWHATDLMLNRPVAVKLIQPHYAQDAEGLARFRAEAQYAGALQHPNIAVVYDYYDEGGPSGQPYLVMELVDGPSLAGVLERGPIGPVPTLDVVAQTAAGLQFAHAAGLVHRDIKPANLLISHGGLLKITDFGIARADTSANLTMTGQVIGTVAYMAPERVSGQPATPASDLYALGMVAHECLTGQRPFEGEPMAVALAQLQQELPPLPASVPPELASLVARLTAKDPRARPVTAGEVAERAVRLRAALTGSGGPGLAGLQAAGATAPVTAMSGGDQFAPTAARSRLGPPGRTMADLPAGGTDGYGGDVAGGQRGRSRRRLGVAAGVAGVAVAAVVGWLVLAPGSQPPKAAAKTVHTHHSTAPAGVARPTSGLLSTGQAQQPTGGGQPTVPVQPSPTPTTAPPSPTVAPTTPPASPSPSASSSASATSPGQPTASAAPSP